MTNYKPGGVDHDVTSVIFPAPRTQPPVEQEAPVEQAANA